VTRRFRQTFDFDPSHRPKEIMMSAKVEKFCDNLKVRLNAIEARVQALNASIKELPSKADQAIQEKIKEVQTKLRAEKDHFEKTRANLMAWGEQKKAETMAMIEKWKKDKQSKELNARAERAEAYAEAMIGVAFLSMNDAESAILDAVAARRDANAAQ